MSANPKRPKDTNQLGKRIVDIAVGVTDNKSLNNNKNPAAVALGYLGGKKGGRSRAERLSPSQRHEIAKKAAKARWKK